LNGAPLSFYIGFDPTADSLHVGHFIQIMVMSHMQRAGHRPIALIGGGTAKVGDPSGRADMRKMLEAENLNANVACFREQFARFLSFEGENGARLINNDDWLSDLNYIDFIREYGRHFSVNRMLSAECYKSRLEKGLTFLEFNYMLMQAYDFLQLYRRYGVILQLGGSDQWSNILAGADLIRRIEGMPAYALTFKLLTTSTGKKMGKTESGAVWLSADKFSPYNFYQYWRNIDDADTERCLLLLTFLPQEEIRDLVREGGYSLNRAKDVLAFEITTLVHGEDEARKARESSLALFGGSGDAENIPRSNIDAAVVEYGMDVLALAEYCALISSKSEGRRLIKEGGLYLNNERVQNINLIVAKKDFPGGKALLRKGKKTYHLAVLS
jgi:tyrosyl-tRNA synthetase